MKRHQNREKAMISVYQNLIMERDYKELIADNYSIDEQNDDSYIMNMIETAISNKERYAGYIDRVLDDWSFSRLGYIEQAILLCGCSEFDLRTVEAPVIINEYIRLAKKYCESDSYKLINGVLDRI